MTTIYGGHLRRPSLSNHFKRPMLVGQVRLAAVLTPELAFNYQQAIYAGNNKTNEINLFMQVQGPNLVTKLGSQITAWNQNWNVAQAKAPEIANYLVMFEGPGPYLWDAAKDSVFQSWQTAIGNLYNIYKLVTEPGGVPVPVPTPPPPTPGGPPPPPPPPTPPSQTSDTVLYVVAGVGGLALAGTLIYALTRK